MNVLCSWLIGLRGCLEPGLSADGFCLWCTKEVQCLEFTVGTIIVEKGWHDLRLHSSLRLRNCTS